MNALPTRELHADQFGFCNPLNLYYPANGLTEKRVGLRALQRDRLGGGCHGIRIICFLFGPRDLVVSLSAVWTREFNRNSEEKTLIWLRVLAHADSLTARHTDVEPCCGVNF